MYIFKIRLAVILKQGEIWTADLARNKIQKPRIKLVSNKLKRICLQMEVNLYYKTKEKPKPSLTLLASTQRNDNSTQFGRDTQLRFQFHPHFFPALVTSLMRFRVLFENC